MSSINGIEAMSSIIGIGKGLQGTSAGVVTQAQRALRTLSDADAGCHVIN